MTSKTDEQSEVMPQPCRCGYEWAFYGDPKEYCHHTAFARDGSAEFVVICPRCRHSGELKARPKWAIAAWNTRSAKTRTLPMTSKTDGPIEVRDEHGNPIASTEPRASLLSVEELTEQRIREGHIRFADDTDLGSVQRFIEHLERSAGSEGVHIDAEECAAFARDLRDALAPKMKLYHLLERCVSFFGSDPPRVYVRRFISEIRDVLTETATLRPSEDDR